jgi:hypothetical protein
MSLCENLKRGLNCENRAPSCGVFNIDSGNERDKLMRAFSTIHVLGWVLSILALAFPTRTVCQEPTGDRPVRWAATELHEVDDDFAYQGEYAGLTLDPHGSHCYRRVGLQVVALGDGQFGAVSYDGGLPGEGWFGGYKTLLRGQLRNSVLELVSESGDVFVTPTVATMNTRRQGMIGAIHKQSRISPTLGAVAPHGAIQLFDGTTTEHFKDGTITEYGWLDKGTELLETFHDFTLHVEFKLPYMPYARGQGRGNSGVYLQSRYEVQVLDSFGLEGRDNECAAVYKYRRPDVNMCFPPLQWQTYDISFRSPRFDAYGNKTSDARLTLVHNGVTVHNNIALKRKTGAGKDESPLLLPIKLQDHGNPVHFRNIWIVPHHVTCGHEQFCRCWTCGTTGSCRGLRVPNGRRRLFGLLRRRVSTSCVSTSR